MWNAGWVSINERSFCISLELIVEATNLSTDGQWFAREMGASRIDVLQFINQPKVLVKKKNGYDQQLLPRSWDKVAATVVKLVTCEGRISVLYGYHFKVLCHLRGKGLICISFFLFKSLGCDLYKC